MSIVVLSELQSADPDQMPHSVVSDLGLHFFSCLSAPIFRVITLYVFKKKSEMKRMTRTSSQTKSPLWVSRAHLPQYSFPTSSAKASNLDQHTIFTLTIWRDWPEQTV